MMRRALIGLIGTLSLLIAATGAVSVYSRWGSPSFARGGAFGAPTPSAGARATTRPSSAPGATTRASAHPTTSATASVRPTERPRPRTIVGGVTRPAPGTYTYDSSGHEQVHAYGVQACAWDLHRSTAVVKDDNGAVVFDWTYSQEREERQILDYRSNGIFTEYLGAAVTCSGFRKTSQGDYTPHAKRLELPLRVGASWTQRVSTQDRTEEISGRIDAHRTITVPAGSFDAYEYVVHVALSGGESGTADQTGWFAPALGLDVQIHQTTDANSGSARFQSDITLRLSARP